MMKKLDCILENKQFNNVVLSDNKYIVDILKKDNTNTSDITEVLYSLLEEYMNLIGYLEMESNKISHVSEDALVDNELDENNIKKLNDITDNIHDYVNKINQIISFIRNNILKNSLDIEVINN